jgi:hypothetical protein
MQAFGSVGGGAGVIAAVVFAALQTGALRRQLESRREEQALGTRVAQAALELRLLQVVIDIDQIFIESAWLRPYFYSDEEIPVASHTAAIVISVAETIIDFAEMVSGQHRYDQITEANYENWRRFLRAYYDTSPAIRHCWAYFGAWYSSDTHELLVGNSTKQGDASVVPRIGVRQLVAHGRRAPRA